MKDLFAYVNFCVDMKVDNSPEVLKLGILINAACAVLDFFSALKCKEMSLTPAK